ncbi:hypothetical protein C7999DRAFT_35301 [Corynascus novoguineensis]|uniref:lytic cellulose monooxygenase (C4-dehydrogenating) n=1 Tax=Corynascus novoguineensis TaxID=1126955 RepID=A0AAN7HGB7_9PEZI|nr:hypothetical protein C7999DRAFT_35301 [Corynascus novoguineensis]
MKEFTVAEQLAPGKYIIRQEIIAHHESFTTFDEDPEGSGTAVPDQGFDFNEGYGYDDPGIAFDMYGEFESYPIPGPEVWDGEGGGKGGGGEANKTSGGTRTSEEIVDPLEHWEWQWLEQNEPYPNDPDGSCAVGERPRDKDARLEVKSSGEFLTVHDYVSTVHPWLMGLRGDLLAALALMAAGQDDPLPPETNLMATWGTPYKIKVVREQDWIRRYTKPASASNNGGSG